MPWAESADGFDLRMPEIDSEIALLHNLHGSSDAIKQRDLARMIGMSLGMTNAVLKRLARKGWIVIRRVNSRNMRYAVTPAGIDQITRRSYRYFRQTIGQIVAYRKSVERIVGEARMNGHTSIVLVGESQLDFIIEHACSSAGLPLYRERPGKSAKSFFLYSERYASRSAPDSAYLQELLLR